MSFTPLPLGAAPDILATITKKRVVLALTGAAIRRLNWSEDEPNVSASLGDGEDAGWLRIALDEDGVTPETADNNVYLTLPRSALPDLTECRLSPLIWRPADGAAIDVRLPTVAAQHRPQPKLAVDNARSRAQANQPSTADDEQAIQVISVPDLYAGLHKSAWENGVELMFLSDGNVVVNGKVAPVDDVEEIVRAAVDKRNAARQRTG